MADARELVNRGEGEVERAVLTGEVVEPALKPIFVCPQCDATITDKQHVREGYCSVCQEMTAPQPPEQELKDRILAQREQIAALTEVKHSGLGWGNFWNYPPPFDNFNNRI